MKFLINELKKKTKTGGKGLCKVFLIHESCEGGFADITKRIAELGNRLNDYDGHNLVVRYGSGTGSMVISNIIQVNWGGDAKILDISIL